MKTEIKEPILHKRDSMAKGEILQKSNKIKENLFNLEEYKKSKTVMFFVSFNNEVDTHEIIKSALKNKTVVVPKVVHHEIEPSLIIDFDNLVPSGRFNIPEPIEIMKIANKNINMVLVPGIAFDKEGYRLGYGFGFYDKFLKKVPKAIKIGLAFDFQVVGNVPRESHDVPVDLVVTEEKIVKCKRTL
ncbi:5-formyltetrahydrofolate cyclo-ligase [Candidatus Woesearchaeota archaeon]|nr:5-formyltetrahydrofolate cyclo-ligase [Candidatus Woesearchaeota archaeon]